MNFDMQNIKQNLSDISRAVDDRDFILALNLLEVVRFTITDIFTAPKLAEEIDDGD